MESKQVNLPYKLVYIIEGKESLHGYFANKHDAEQKALASIIEWNEDVMDDPTCADSPLVMSCKIGDASGAMQAWDDCCEEYFEIRDNDGFTSEKKVRDLACLYCLDPFGHGATCDCDQCVAYSKRVEAALDAEREYCQYIEVMGEEADVNGLAEAVRLVFGVDCEVDTLDSSRHALGLSEDPRIRFEDDSDAMTHAFNLGLMMYVRGFVASKSLGKLRIIDDSEQ